MSSLYGRHASTMSAPNDWEFNKFKYLVNHRNFRVGLNSSNYSLLSLTLKGVIPRNLEEGGKNPENYETYKEVFPGDLVFCQFDYDVTPRTVGIVNEQGMVTGAYTILKPTPNVDIKFLYYFFLSLDFKKDLLYLCTGLRNTLSDKSLFGLEIPLPSKDHQKKIARFLDHKVASIDQAISKKKKLINLVEEKRRRQITGIMTKGLNEKIFRESGIEWLGKVPKIYEQTYLLDIAFERKEKNYKGLDPQLLSLSYGKIITKDKNELGGLLPESFDTYQLLNTGNIVLRLTDLQNDHISLRIGFVGQPGMITSAYSSLTAKPKILPKYLYYYLHSADLLKVFYSMGGGVRQSMKFVDLKRLAVILPKKRTQEKVVVYLDHYNQRVDNSKKTIRDSIDLLEEYKTSLISNAVTGRMKI